MFSYKKPIIIILSLLFFSCGETIETRRDSVEVDRRLLSQTDSLLSIVDEEFQHIIHDKEIKDEEFHRLEDKVQEYQNVIVLDKEEQNNLTQRLEEMVKVCEKKDSINKVLLLNIENLNYQIKKIQESKFYLNSQMKEQTELYESQIYRLDDSLNVLNNKIITLENFIINNVRKSKLQKIE